MVVPLATDVSGNDDYQRASGRREIPPHGTDSFASLPIVALEPTTLLRLDYEEAMELTLARPDLRRLWLKTYAGSLRKLFLGAAPKRSTMMLALIHDSPATRPLAQRLIRRLCDVGEQVGV